MSHDTNDDRGAASENAQPKRSTDAGLRARQRVIGAGLKRLFDDVVDERVPDDFSDLLAKFDSRSEGNAEGGER